MFLWRQGAGKSLPASGVRLLRVTLKCPFNGAPVPWSELGDAGPLSGRWMGCQLLGPKCQLPPPSPNKRGNKREKRRGEADCKREGSGRSFPCFALKPLPAPWLCQQVQPWLQRRGGGGVIPSRPRAPALVPLGPSAGPPREVPRGLWQGSCLGCWEGLAEGGLVPCGWTLCAGTRAHSHTRSHMLPP